MEWEKSLCRSFAHIATVPLGGLHVVGVDGARRRQQQKEALQLVVRGLWRPMRMANAQQDTGGAAWCDCQ